MYLGTKSSLAKVDTINPPEIALKRVEAQKFNLHIKLKQFLELPQVFNKIVSYIEKENASQDLIFSIYQGSLWKDLSKSFGKKTVFPLFLFFDDFEPCNALGSRAGVYKIGAVYLTLACIPPEFSCYLENIFLAHIFYSSDRETFGNKQIFSKLIDDLKSLERDGITISTENGTEKVYFTLLLLLGDNLGLNSIMGFSGSFSSDFFCRICTAHRSITRTETNEGNFIIRTKENYDLDSLTHANGVKENCIWNELPNFHAGTNFCTDLMHDMLEGVLRYDMAYIINELMRKKYFTLDHLNNRIKFFKLSKTDVGNGIPQIKR